MARHKPLNPLRGGLLFLVWMALPFVIHVWGEEAKKEKAPLENPVLEIYDVADLTAPIKNFTAPDYFEAFPNGNQEKPFLHPSEVNPVTPEGLENMLKNLIEPDNWDAARGTSIEQRGGMLATMQHPAVHTKIQALLRSFHVRANLQLLLRGLVVEARERPATAILSKEELTAFLRQKEQVRVLSRPRLSLFNTKRAFLVSGTERHFIADFEVSGDNLDPVIRVGLSGYLLEACATANNDWTGATVEIKFEWSRSSTPEPEARQGNGREVGQSQTTPRAALEADRKAPARPAERLQVGMLDPARTAHGKIETELRIPLGKWVLAGALEPSQNQETQGPILLFLQLELPLVK